MFAFARRIVAEILLVFSALRGYEAIKKPKDWNGKPGALFLRTCPKEKTLKIAL